MCWFLQQRTMTFSFSDAVPFFLPCDNAVQATVMDFLAQHHRNAYSCGDPMKVSWTVPVYMMWLSAGLKDVPFCFNSSLYPAAIFFSTGPSRL